MRPSLTAARTPAPRAPKRWPDDRAQLASRRHARDIAELAWSRRALLQRRQGLKRATRHTIEHEQLDGVERWCGSPIHHPLNPGGEKNSWIETRL
ncbi:hypothetical protein, partial [Mycolicibacterium hassiacum]|uniref:hypothetical protein n=1 Tax=Mycolicibacterium hassiacum TaxID=46351 RepID=UPI001EE648B7